MTVLATTVPIIEECVPYVQQIVSKFWMPSTEPDISSEMPEHLFFIKSLWNFADYVETCSEAQTQELARDLKK